jgi:hypothetical protein
MCYTFDVAKCDRIFDYLLLEQLNNVFIVNDKILILMLLMIAMFSIIRFKRP